MKVYGLTQDCGLGYYARLLAKALKLDFANIFDIFKSPSSYDGIVVMGANGPFVTWKMGRAIVPFWEFYEHPVVPLGPFDRLVCPSSFIASIFGSKGEVLPPPAKPERRVKPNPDFTIMYCFDSRSNMARKNPYSLISACDSMWPHPKLIIKTNTPAPDGIPSFVEWIDGFLNQDDYDALFGRASVYCSPHKSEGIGMTIIEAMGRGLPIVATGYGGNVEFMDSRFSVSVPYRMEHDDAFLDHSAYLKCTKTPFGASINEGSLANSLSELRDSPEKINTMGEYAAYFHAEMMDRWNSIDVGMFI